MGKEVVFQKWRWTEINVTLGLIFVALLRKEWPMTFIAVRCPHCQSDQIVKRGKTARAPSAIYARTPSVPSAVFLLDYCNRGCLPEVKQTIIDMSLNASGVRDTARSLPICPNTGATAQANATPRCRDNFLNNVRQAELS